jgi:hypothetical protein
MCETAKLGVHIMGYIKSRLAIRCLAGAAAAGGFLGAWNSASAIAPNDQLIYTIDPNAGGTSFPIGTTLYSAVEVVNSTGGYGTGSVVGAFSNGGNYYFDVLTADHVVRNNVGGLLVNGNIGYGTPQPPNALSAPTDPYQVVATGGATGQEDMALLAVNVGPTTNLIDKAFYNLMTPLAVTPYAVPNPYQSLSLPFTEIGYGQTSGNQNFGAIPGYTAAAGGGYKRFQNNFVQAITTPTTFNYVPNISYNYQAVDWLTVAPSNRGGYGGMFPGDSGGPYLMPANGNPANAPPSNVNVYGRPGGTVTIPIYNNNIFAIDTAFYPPTSAPSTSVNNTLNMGELLTSADAAWINGYLGDPTPVPEPAALTVLALGGGLFLIRRRRGTSNT